jgi:hypothetical protein
LATQFFSDEQMERLRSYPDIGREELIRFFTLTRKDLGFVDNLGHGGGRGPAARLGLAVQLCTLPWLGFVPDDIWSVPQAAVLRLANQHTPLCPPASAVIGPGPYQLLDELVANRFAGEEPLKQHGTAQAGVLLGVEDDARRLQQSIQEAVALGDDTHERAAAGRVVVGLGDEGGQGCGVGSVVHSLAHGA